MKIPVHTLHFVCMYIHACSVCSCVCVCVACTCRLSSLQFVNLEVDEAAVAAIRI